MRFLSPLCVVCLVETAYTFAKMAEANPDEQMRKLLNLTREVEALLRSPPATYAELGKRFCDACVRVLGDFDYFRPIKEASNEVALRLAPAAEAYVRSATSRDERLRRAVKVALVGNALDFGTGVYEVSLEGFEAQFSSLLSAEVAVDESGDLLAALRRSKRVLYVLDNAGEVVLDRLLISELASMGLEVTAAVRGALVQNDATIEDAERAGIGGVARVITTGSAVPGIVVSDCSEEFLRELREADLVVLKGQGNYQSIEELLKLRSEGLAFLLVVKCDPVARDLGVQVGDMVAKLV